MNYLLVSDVAKRYGISRRTVLRMIDRGSLPAADKLGWDRTGPYLLDAEAVREVFGDQPSEPTPARVA